MITQEFDLNLIPNSAPIVVHVNQYDVGAGRLIAHLYDGEVAYTPASGATALIEGTKPDKKGYSYYATISGSTVTANLTQQMSVVPGRSRVNLIIKEGNNRTGTFVFILDVQATGLSDDTDTSSSELAPYIDGAQAAAREAAASAQTAVDAKNTAVSAKDTAVSAKNDAVSAKNAAEEAAEIATESNTHPPYIGTNGNWYVWNTTTNQYVDSGVDASITVSVDPNTVTLPAGSSASVQNTGTDTDPVFKFSIPQGAKGDKGDIGNTPNVSATASVDANTGTPSVTVSKSGTADNPSFGFAFKNLKGAKGDKGDKGDKGESAYGIYIKDHGLVLTGSATIVNHGIVLGG